MKLNCNWYISVVLVSCRVSVSEENVFCAAFSVLSLLAPSLVLCCSSSAALEESIILPLNAVVISVLVTAGLDSDLNCL